MRLISNDFGQTSLAFIFLVLLVLASSGASFYLYLDKERQSGQYLHKIEGLNKNILSLSEYSKKRDIENLEMRNALDNAKKELEEYKAKFQSVKEDSDRWQALSKSIESEFEKLTKSLQTGFSKLDNMTRVFDAKLTASQQQKINSLPPSQSKSQSFKQNQSIKTDNSIELPTVVVKANEKEVVDLGAPIVPQMNSVSSQEKTFEKKMPLETEILSKEDVSQKEELNSKIKKQIKVMNVNQAHKFFVINKGLIDGVKVGNRLEIYRKDIKVGLARLSEVRELISLAEIEEQFGGHFIETGDVAVLA